MPNTTAKVYLALAAGAIAGILQTLAIWLTGKVGIFTLLRLPLEFELNIHWFYQRITWGALWGLLFLIPILRERAHWQRGVLFGLAPAMASLLVFLPFKNQQGFLGLELGAMMPVVVLVFGVLWGVLAGFFLTQSEMDEDELLE